MVISGERLIGRRSDVCRPSKAYCSSLETKYKESFRGRNSN